MPAIKKYIQPCLGLALFSSVDIASEYFFMDQWEMDKLLTDTLGELPLIKGNHTV